MAKKKRSAKQIAATKKLVALNKKRRGSKKKSAKKKSRKKNPVPTLYQVAAKGRATKNITYFDGVSFTRDRSNAAMWRSKTKAANAAKRTGRRCAIVPTNTRPDVIRAALTGKV